MSGKKVNNDDRTFLCFDLGTTRIKSALVGTGGKIIYLNSEKSVSYYEGDSVIQKPEEYYDAVVRQIEKIRKEYKRDFENADSLICSGQMAGILSVDKNWEVVMPWTYSVDTRANKYLGHIEDKMASRIRGSSGGVPFMAAKIKWIKNEFPQEYKRSYRFINLTTYVAGRLAGLSGDGAFTDYSVLAMNGLANIDKEEWNKNIIEDLDLDISKLPEIVRPYRKVGIITKQRFGSKNDIKVLAGIGDQIAGFIGAGVLKKGDLVDVAGTYTVLGLATDRFIPDIEGKIISLIYSGIEDIYYQLAVVAVGGYLYKWFIEKFSYDDSRLKKAKDTKGLYFIPHIGGRTAPPQPYYEGTFYGLKWNHDLDSIYTAMLKCMSFEYDFIYSKILELDHLKRDKLEKIKVIGGGARNHIWNEMKASILELEYAVMENTSFEILGNYLIARYGNNIRKGYSDLLHQNIVSVLENKKPEKEKIEYYRDQKELYRKVVDRVGEIYRDFRKE